MSDNATDSFRRLPQTAEDFGTIPQAAETFRSVPQITERQESHTLTVREVARMFESACVARTERSIINWCHPNKLGVCRLDAYFDPNERKHFITPQSVALAIKEEQTKANKSSDTPVGNFPNGADTDGRVPRTGDKEDVDVTALERELTDLKITNRAKDYFIDQLKSERKTIVEQLMTSSHKVGELEAKLLQLEAPRTTGETMRAEPIERTIAE